MAQCKRLQSVDTVCSNHTRPSIIESSYMPKDVYEELAIDMVINCNMNMFDARKAVKFLDEEGHIDYDALKEHYLSENDD